MQNKSMERELNFCYNLYIDFGEIEDGVDNSAENEVVA